MFWANSCIPLHFHLIAEYYFVKAIEEIRYFLKKIKFYQIIFYCLDTVFL